MWPEFYSNNRWTKHEWKHPKPVAMLSHIEIQLSIRLKLTLIKKNNLTDWKFGLSIWIEPSQTIDLQRSIFVSG